MKPVTLPLPLLQRKYKFGPDKDKTQIVNFMIVPINTVNAMGIQRNQICMVTIEPTDKFKKTNRRGSTPKANPSILDLE